MTRSILAGDIGGNRGRFAAFEWNDGNDGEAPPTGLLKRAALELKIVDYGSADALLEAISEADFPLKPDKADLVVLAVPTKPEERKPGLNGVNVGRLNRAGGRNRSPDRTIILINGIAAWAYGCLTKASRGAIPLQVEAPSPDNRRIAVVGVDARFDACMVAKAGETGYICVQSAFGHAPFPFETPEEQKFQAFLRDRLGIVEITYQTVVSVPGLSRLHQFLNGKPLPPAKIPEVLKDDLLLSSWLARFFGRACRNFALTVPPSVLYICGGVAARHPSLVDNDIFLEEFVDSHAEAGLLNEIPLLLNPNEQTVLWGAALYGAMRLREHG